MVAAIHLGKSLIRKPTRAGDSVHALEVAICQEPVLDLLPPLPDAAPVRAAAMTVRPYSTVVLMGGQRGGLELS